MNWILGVEGSIAYNIDTKKEDYALKIEVSQDVYDWLDSHDIEYTENRDKIFIVNNLRYVDLGPKLEVVKIQMGKGGTA